MRLASKAAICRLRSNGARPGVLLLDTYELLAGLDDWLRDTLLPQLPAGSLAVIAGRNEAGTSWRTHVDWAALTHTRRLGNLGPDESRTYLTRCGVPAQHHEDALAFAHGHPLALSLTADVLTRGDRLASSRLDAEPEIVRLLIERFVQEVPSREHRLALHACVTVRALTEPVLAAALDRHDVRDLFEWLGHLSFIESGPYGLFPHDLARDVVYMDFRWRDPDAAYRVIERLIGYYYERLERSPGPEGLRIWFDLIYLQRYNAHLRPFLQWAGFSTTFAQTACPVDHDAILEMVERHEGGVSASIARHWLQRQPEAFLMVRSMAGELIGFVCHLRLEAVTPEDLAADPAVARAFAHADRHGSPVAGEHTTYCRFLMDRERYQAHVLAPDCGKLFAELDGGEVGLVLHRGCRSGHAGADVHGAPHLARPRRGLRSGRPALWRVRARLARRERRSVAAPEGRTRVADRARAALGDDA